MSNITFKIISDNQEILDRVLRHRNFQNAMYFNLAPNPIANGGAGRGTGYVQNFYEEPERKEGVLKFIEHSRIDNRPFFTAYRADHIMAHFDQGENTFAVDETIVEALQLPIPEGDNFYIAGLTNVRVELISTLDDHRNNLRGNRDDQIRDFDPDRAAQAQDQAAGIFNIEGLFYQRPEAVDMNELFTNRVAGGPALLGTILARTILSDDKLKSSVFAKLEEEFRYSAINGQFLHFIKSKIKITKEGLIYTDENDETRTLTSAGEIGLLFLQIVNDLKENVGKNSQTVSVKNFFDKLSSSSEQDF